MKLTGTQALSRAQALYTVLPRAGFTRGTFMELGEAAEVGRPFRMLSVDLKATLFRMVATYGKELADIVREEQIARDAEQAEQLQTEEAYANANEILGDAGTEVALAGDRVAREIEQTEWAAREARRTIAVEKIAAVNLDEPEPTPLAATVTVETTTTNG